MTQINNLAVQNSAKRVTGIKVRIGALSHMSPEHFREHFEESSRGSVAETAKLDIELDTDERSETAQDIILERIDVETLI